jgi:hypothetical protein
MSYQFIEVSPRDVVLDRSAVERDDGFVYEHLKRYCSKFAPLPAITVKLAEGRLITVRGHKYLSIALELGHDRIRAVLQGTTFDELRKQGVPGLLSAVPNASLESEQNTAVITGWHIFFFKSTPSSEVAARIEARFRSFLKQSLPAVLGADVEIFIEVRFDFSGPCLELKFSTPVTNQAWADSYRAFVSSVSNEILPIDTYQGRRFTA